MSRKKTVWIIVSVFLLMITGGLAYYVFSNSAAPDPALQSRTTMAKYMASDEFAKLSKEEKSKYFAKVDTELEGERLPREGLTEAEQKKLRENMGPLMRERFNNRIKEYFKLSPEEKKAFLDKMAEDMKNRRENGGARPGGDTANAQGQGQQPRTPSADRARNRIENTPPDERAMHAQFMKDMQANRAAQQKK